jgi:hypothetical protein
LAVPDTFDPLVVVEDPQVSLGWLRELNAIDDNDLAVFEGLKNARNTIAHEMHQLASGSAPSKHVAELPKLVALLRKIEVWWIMNVENSHESGFR